MNNVQMPAWMADFFKPYRHKCAEGGRGSSKSWGFSSAFPLYAIQGHERILCAREFQNSIKESVKRLLEDQIRRMGLEKHFKFYKTEIACPATDSLFLFAGIRTNPESIKSLEGITKVWIEEAQTISQESIDILIPTIRAEGSELWWSLNRRHKTDPVDKMFFGKDGAPPNSLVRKVNYMDNPWFPDVLRQEMEWDRRRDPDKYRHVWLGEPVMHSEAQVFYGCWRIDNVPEPPKGTPIYYGADWGFSQDPSTLVRFWMSEDESTVYVDYEAYKVGVEIDHLPALFDTVPDSRRYTIIGDNARPETISYLRRQGFKIEPSKKGKGSIEEGVAWLKSKDIVIDPRCKHAIDEFSLYSYKVDKRTGLILPDLVDKDNHIIDPLRYASEKLRNGKSFLYV